MSHNPEQGYPQDFSSSPHFPISTFSQLCDATVWSCTVNSSVPHPGCPEAGRIDVLCKKQDLRWRKNVANSLGLGRGCSLSNVICEREAGSGQRKRD